MPAAPVRRRSALSIIDKDKSSPSLKTKSRESERADTGERDKQKGGTGFGGIAAWYIQQQLAFRVDA